MNVPDASIKCLEFDQACEMYVYNILLWHKLIVCYTHTFHIRNPHAHSVHEYVYNSSVGGYDWDFCVCVQHLHSLHTSLAMPLLVWAGRKMLWYFIEILIHWNINSFAAVQVQFAQQNYTVIEGDVVDITLVTNTSDYEFNFTVTLQYMDGTATGESFNWDLTLQECLRAFSLSS